MTARKLAVQVIDDSRASRCEGGCGIDWTKPELRETLFLAFRQRFGERVTVSFVDAAGEATIEIPDLLEKVQSGSLSLPVLAIDGKLRIAGYFDTRMACDMVEVALETYIE